eukprot:2873811-Amphidinium_carterae.1
MGFGWHALCCTAASPCVQMPVEKAPMHRSKFPASIAPTGSTFGQAGYAPGQLMTGNALKVC